MKAKRIILIFILPFLFGFTSDKISNSGDDTSVAVVKKIIKDVTYKKANVSDWEFAKTGLPLKNDEQVKTGSKSLALILFSDGSGLLRVRENSILHIYGSKEEKKVNKNTFIEKGLIGFDVNRQADEEFKFTTPTAVASIRGTAGFIDVDENNTTTLSLEHGTVEFESTKGDKKSGTVTGGNSATIDSEGNIEINPTSEKDKKKHDQTRSLNTKKVTIKTNRGTIVLEYYSSEN